jgi:hypothetical protein
MVAWICLLTLLTSDGVVIETFNGEKGKWEEAWFMKQAS